MTPARLTWLAVAFAAALPAWMSVDPATDPDTWWHLRVGRLVAETGTVPDADPFSRPGRDEPTRWVAYSWLYELGLHHAYGRFGEPGLTAARAMLCALSTTAVLWVVVRHRPLTPATGLLAVVAAVTLAPLAKERPWHFTIAFTAVTLGVVTDLRAGAQVRRAIWLPAVFALWANLHIQFVLGWGVLGLACLFPGRAGRGGLVALTAGCVAATLLNPYHVRLLVVVWEYATQTGPLRAVRELAPADPSHPWTWAGLALLGWAAVVTARRRPVDWFAVALLAVGLVLMVRMRRDVWFAAVAAAAVLRDPVAETDPRRLVGVAGLVLGLFVAARLVAGTDPSADARAFPVAAACYVREHRPAGPLFNPFDWGGYLIWALPEYPVSVDGRTNLYGSERITRSMATWAGEPGWEADPDLVTSRLVIAPREWRLTALLRERPGEWRVAFDDGTAVVFARK